MKPFLTNEGRINGEVIILKCDNQTITVLQTHHVDSTLKRRGNDCFHVVSTWNPRGVFVGRELSVS